VNVAVFVSGNGTNLQALLDAELAPARIALVISNRPDARALDRARAASVPAVVVDHKQFAERAAFEDALVDAMAPHAIELVVLAGFMRVLTTRFLARFAGRVVNTHPSLLPAFPGVDAAAQAIAYGVKISGATVHFVDASLDGGPIIAQVPVPVRDDDDAHALQARIQREEHALLPRVVRLLARGAVTCEGRSVRLDAE
jgi:phosphoribosylglycinamide formyltransferase-1